ncbi:MAG TPA: transposase [Gemmatimonadaceae bacterium]|jgi:putative transposase
MTGNHYASNAKEPEVLVGRLLRYVVPGQPQHVIQRGNNRSAIFAANADYVFFSNWLAAACELHGCSIHAYVLMTNHVHLLITPHNACSIASVMQTIGRRYVRYFNITYRRTGSLWEGRYRATLVDSDKYLLACYRYIELNPVRSGNVAAPAEYRWSSFRANAHGEADPLVTPHDRYCALGADPTSRRAAYCALFLDSLADSTLGEIRESTHRGWPLGDHEFRTGITKLVNRRAYPGPRGRPKGGLTPFIRR